EVVVHVVVTVPAAVLLDEVDRERGAARQGKVLRGREDRLALLVAAPRPRIDTPGGVVLAVDGEFHPTRDAFLARLVVEIPLQRSYGVGVIGGRLVELDGAFLVRLLGVRRLDLELAQRTGSLERAPGPTRGQIGILEQLQAE